MKRLIVDNSNTRTKFALVQDAGIVEQRVLRTAEVSVDSVRKLLHGWDYELVVVCSVVPVAAKHIAEACGEEKVVFLSPHGVDVIDFSGYAGIDTLGADRVANAVAAVQSGNFPVVAVDMGTATTFDVVVRREGCVRYLGGVIAPGVSAFANCLHENTALLPSMAGEVQGPDIGRTTREAMAAAVRVGYPAMIDGILDGIEKELGEYIHVVITGGDASTIVPSLRREFKLEPLLTLKGIALASGMSI